jgi:hypothetical protein
VPDDQPDLAAHKRPDADAAPGEPVALARPAPADEPLVPEGDPVKVHPPHAPIHSLKDFFIQLITITAGVLIALSCEGLLEWNHNRNLVREARSTMEREIADNRQDIDGELAAMGGRRKDVGMALQLVNELLTTKKSAINQMSLGFSFAELSAASWQTAERTGALAHMEYAEVQEYSSLYGTQAVYAGLQQRVLDRLAEALAFAHTDPHQLPARDLEMLRQHLLGLNADFTLLEQLGRQLRDAYAKVLESP